MKLGVVFILAVVLLITGCPPDKPNVVLNPQPMYKFYVDHHWVPLAEPDSRFGPGTVFTLAPGDDPRWQGSLQDCGLPATLVAPVQGSAGKLAFNMSGDYGASAVLQLKGVSVGPDFSKVKTASLTLDQHGPSSLNMIQIRIWINDPSNKDKIPQTCKDILNAPNTYIVQEAYSVSKGTYTLKDNASAKISLKGLNVGPLAISADAHASPTADGSLTFDQTLYTAVRKLVYANGGWESLGRPDDQSSADTQVINQLSYFQNNTHREK